MSGFTRDPAGAPCRDAGSGQGQARGGGGDEPTTALPGRPPVVDLATWQTARDEFLVREKGPHPRGRRPRRGPPPLPMVELDGTVEVVGPDGRGPFLDLFQDRDELVVHKHMWYDDAPHQGQCEGCTTTAWH